MDVPQIKQKPLRHEKILHRAAPNVKSPKRDAQIPKGLFENLFQDLVVLDTKLHRCYLAYLPDNKVV